MKILIHYFVFFLFAYNFSSSLAAATTINDCFVELDYGRLRGGIRRTVLNGMSFCSYKGIPYAKPPIGNLRFTDPDDVPESWTGIRDANKEGKSCIQNDLMFGRDSSNVTSEDCLYLNVYTPIIRRHSSHNYHTLFPVMVWIHGGGYLFGNADEYLYGPDFLVEHNVVLVTFNYRLGIFGFLNLGNDEVPGNAGLKDQVAALKWVKKYIHLFGGNPDRVTVFGESAGAASVQYHLISNMSNGLFHQAILQSGAVLSPWALNVDIKNEAFQMGKLLGCKLNYDNDSESLLICFREKPQEALKMSQLMVLDSEDTKRGLFFTFLPSIEVSGTGKSNFLTSHPEKLIKRGHFKKVPCLIGFNTLEGFMFLKALNITGPDAISQTIKNFSWLSIPTSLGLEENSVEFQQVRHEVDGFYYNNLPITWDSVKPFCDLVGDNSVVMPMYRSIEMMVKHSNEPIYAYEFAIDANRGIMKAFISHWNPLLNNLTGVSHFDEIGYLFNLQPYGEIPVVKNSTEEMAIKRLTALWTNFAKTGNPNGHGLKIHWEPVQVNQDNCLRIEDSSMTLLKSSCEPKRTQFWKNIYNTYRGV